MNYGVVARHALVPVLLGLLCLLAAGFPALASETVASILSVKPMAWAERQGSKIDLAPKTSLQVKDIVSCDASGKVQILFEDDTTVTVAPGATVRLADFSFDDSKASFAVDVVGGMSRFVTGEVAKRNPKGFRVDTPQATIGVRGTDFTVLVGADITTAILNQTDGVGLDVTNLGTGEHAVLSTVGNAIDISGTRTMERQATPAEMASVAKNTRNSGGTADVGTLAADLGTAPKGGRGPEGAAGDSFLVAYENTNAVTGVNPGLSLNAPGAGPPNVPTPGPPSGPDISSISGTYMGGYSGLSGSWSDIVVLFSVNTRATISGAQVILTVPGLGELLFTGGSGSIQEGGNFSVSGFTPGDMLVNIDSANMNGRFDSPSDGTTHVNMGGTDSSGTPHSADMDVHFNKSP